MRLIKINFIILILLMSPSLSFAMPGIKITHPENNSTVNPGEQIVITLESVEGFVISRGRLGTLNFFTDEIWNLPATFTVTIPQEATGILTIMAIANGKGNIVSQDEITLRIVQTATLQSLVVNPDKISIKKDWDGNINYYERDRYWHIGIKGMYSDGVTREISDIGTTYTSTDSAIASVNTEGEVTVDKVGEAKIIVSNSGVTAEIPVIFEDPQGIRPLETKPPTISMDIQSPANNQGGWYNNDITITITAQDNEGGSGIQEIAYQFPRFSAESERVQNDQVTIPFSEEGVSMLRYIAYDNERNSSGQQSMEIRIDKTPPQTTAIISPPPDAGGLIKSLPAKVSFTGTDNLSGIAYTTPEKVFTAPGTYQVEYYSRDVAGNVESPKTITVKIAVEDTTPPQITLRLQRRLGWWSWFNFYRLVYSAVDDNSGVKEVKAGLVMPNVANFTFKIKESKNNRITIDEKKRIVTIDTPQPQTILTQLKQGLLLIDNNQLLHLNRTTNQGKWKIDKNGPYLFIKAPLIVFKVQATDNAGNSASQELKFSGKN